MEHVKRTLLELRWRYGKLRWMVSTEQGEFSIDTETFQRHFVKKLAENGLEWKSWYRHMQDAQDAWTRQCAIEDALRADIAYWKQVPEVHATR